MRLAYRPPLDWQSILGFLRERAIPGVQSVVNEVYQRSIEVDGESGIIEIMRALDGLYLILCIQLPTMTRLAQIVDRVRRIFDLDADPIRIAGKPFRIRNWQNVLEGRRHVAPSAPPTDEILYRSLSHAIASSAATAS